MKKGFIIAIDGPLASGKGTIAKKLAHLLHGIDLYTGAMYRCVALFCMSNGISLQNTTEVIAQLPRIKIVYKKERILLNNVDVTETIQDGAIAEGASMVGVIPQVRHELLQRQQEFGREEMAQGKIVVVEGRDIGTAVFPDAAFKIYLTASEFVRAKRRLVQYQNHGEESVLEEVREQIRIRDKRDSEREVDPLTTDPKKQGYFVLDNSDKTEEETLDALLTELKRRNLI